MSQRLIFVVNNPDFFISHRLPVARAAKATGYEVHVATPLAVEYEGGVATPRTKSIAIIENEGFIFHPVNLNRRGMNPFREGSAIFELFRLYRRVRPDIVHHVTIKPVLYGGIAARFAGVPAMVSAVSGFGYVFLSRGFFASCVRVFVQAAYRFAFGHPRSAVILQNPDDRVDFLRWHLVDAGKIEMIRGSGVDMALFTSKPEPSGPPVVVLPARLLCDKGVYEFVEAARVLRSKGVLARFALVGGIDEGNPAGISRQTVEKWVGEGAVEWWGLRDDMQTVFSESHVVCLPSYREGLPKALVEAAACARAIVTTDVSGCRETVDNGVNGLLVPARDAVALAVALEKVINDRETRLAMGQAGRKKVESALSVETVVSETLALYRKLSV